MKEHELIQHLDSGSYETAFKSHFKGLHGYAFTIVKDDVIAEEMVQNVFFKLWSKREQLNIESSLKAYLFKAVYHECLNYLRQLKVKSEYQSFAMHRNHEEVHDGENKVVMRELEHNLRKAIEELPEQCRMIFQLSRFNELRYREIAEHLNISVKTVENQMGKALRVLRLKLVDFMPVIMIVLNVLN